MPSEQTLVKLTKAFQARLELIHTRAGQLTAVEWDRLGSWDEVDIERFARRVDPVFTAARQATVNASAGYYSLATETAPVLVPDVAIAVQANLRAPFTAYWHGLAEGRPWDEALAAGRSRATSTAVDYVASTSRRTASFVAGDGIVGWRRVLTANSCAWCATVSTQRYRSAESADFGHDHCDCIVAPIYGDADPGQVINQVRVDELEQLERVV